MCFNGTLILIVRASWGNLEDFDMFDKRQFAFFLEYCVELCGVMTSFLWSHHEFCNLRYFTSNTIILFNIDHLINNPNK